MSLEYRNFNDMATCIRRNIHKLDNDFNLIVGIPRSGMIPAYMIALFKNIKACSLDEFLNDIIPSNGLSRQTAHQSNTVKKILIVDDSIHSGVSLNHVKERIHNYGKDQGVIIKYCAIFAREASKNMVDYYFSIVPTPRIFEWNYLHMNIVEKSCFDIDGVLCVDPTKEQNDDGKEYKNFILNATPLYIPNYTIDTIVTSRLEKYRKETEYWLNLHNVKYKELVMLNATAEERVRNNLHAKHKAKVYLEKTNTCLFVESEPKQAEEIAKLTGKPCICTADDVLYNFPKIIPNIDLIDINALKAINKKRILLYSHEFTYTGAPHSLLRICKVILTKGYFVEVWGPQHGEFEQEFKKIGVTVRIIPYNLFKMPNIKNAICLYDLALVNTVVPYLAYLELSKYIPTIWYIREATNLPQICKGVPLRELALKQAKNIYCVSEYAQDFIKKNYNKKVKVIHNCVEDFYESQSTKEAHPDKTKINFVTLGTITHRKAYDIFINAFKSMPIEYQNKAHLYFAGRLIESRKDYWEPLLEDIKGDPNITYVGEILDIDDKIEFMKKMDVTVVVSRDESCSLVVLEGAMLAKALIVSENVGAKYMVTKNNGYIVPTNNITSLANAYMDIIDHPEKLSSMGKSSRSIYEKEATIPLYEENIGKMINTYLHKNAKIYRIKRNLADSYFPRNLKLVFLYTKKYGIEFTCKKILNKLTGKNKTKKTITYWGSFITLTALSSIKSVKVVSMYNKISILSLNQPGYKEPLKFEKDFNLTRSATSDIKKTVSFKKHSDYLVIDLLDERFSLCKTLLDNKKCVLTKTDYLLSNLHNIKFGDRELSISDLNYYKLSPKDEIKSVISFCNLIKMNFPQNRVIVNILYFPTVYYSGDSQIEFNGDDLKIINNNNQKLARIYSVFKKELPRAKYISLQKYAKVVKKENESPRPTQLSSEYYEKLQLELMLKIR